MSKTAPYLCKRTSDWLCVGDSHSLKTLSSLKYRFYIFLFSAICLCIDGIHIVDECTWDIFANEHTKMLNVVRNSISKLISKMLIRIIQCPCNVHRHCTVIPSNESYVYVQDERAKKDYILFVFFLQTTIRLQISYKCVLYVYPARKTNTRKTNSYRSRVERT